MRKYTLIITFFLSIYACVMYGQNDVLVNHYMFNELSFNPAVAGYTSSIEATLLTRQQWMGIDESPSTQVFNIHTYKKKIGGMGLSLTNDRLGFEGTLNLKLMYAHYIQVGHKAFLSLGAGAGFINKSIKGKELFYADNDDEGALIQTESRLKPDFSFGIEFNNPYLTLGLSSTHIEQSLTGSSNFKVPRHYYAYAKCRIEVSDKINIVPTFLAKSSQFITQYDLNTLFYYDNRFWLGASYRIKEAYVGIFGFNINKNIKFSYSYDYTLGPATLYNTGSHEVMLGFSFGKKK